MISGAIQEALVAILCYDEEHSKLVRSLLIAKVFDPFYSEIVDDVHRYIDQYEKPPLAHTYDIVEALKARKPASAETLSRIYESLQETKLSINADYVIKQATMFARRQRLQTSIGEAIELLDGSQEDGAVIQAEAALVTGLAATAVLFDAGLLVNDSEQALRFLENSSDDQIFLGIKELDDRGICPTRKRLMIFIALYGKGKSWFCTWCAKMGLMQRKRVLYISCEMTEEETAGRIVSSLFSVTKRRQDVIYSEFERDDLGRFVNMTDITVSDRPSYKDNDIVTNLAKKIDDKLARAPRMYVKSFTPNALTIKELEGYLDALEMTKNFIPDLLIVDYPDQMQVDPRYQRQELSRIYKELRGIGIKRNVAIVAPTQANRAAENQKQVKGQHVGEDISKIQTADFALAYSQTDMEHEMDLARVYVAKGRSDQDRFEVILSQAYAMGQFVVDSAMLAGKSYWNRVTARNSNLVPDDDDDPKPQPRKKIEDD